MIVLGVVLLVLCVLLVLGTVFGNGQEVPDLNVFGVSLTNVSAAGLFVGGVVTGAVAALALSLILGAAARKRHKAVERKREVQDVRGTANALQQENAQLRERLSAADDQRGSTAL